MNSKPFKDKAEENEFSYWQVLMSELDSSLSRMEYISSADMKDAYENEQFSNFWDEIKNSQPVIVSVSDNADLYEVGDDSILITLIDNLNEKVIVFDKQDKRKLITLIQKSDD